MPQPTPTQLLRATTLELRVEQREGEPAHIRGYGAVFYRSGDPGTEYPLAPDVVERFSSRAFDRAIEEEQDIRSLFNHNPDFVLGRMGSGTLTLEKTKRGLVFDVVPPDTQFVRDQVLEPIRRGDVSGASIMFVVRKTTWTEESLPDGRELLIRGIEDVDLWEIGPVTFPAYKGTTAGVRSYSHPGSPTFTAILEERNQWLHWRQQHKEATERAKHVAANARG